MLRLEVWSHHCPLAGNLQTCAVTSTQLQVKYQTNFIIKVIISLSLYISISPSPSLSFFLTHNHAHISDPKTTANNPGSVKISSTDNLEDRRGQEDRSLAASVDSGLSSMASGASTASDLIDCVEELIALLEVTNTTKEATKCASDKVQSTFITSGASLLSLSLSVTLLF